MPGESLRAVRREEPLPEIPGYEMAGFVGRGSSGNVYRARQLAVDREVAIKILHPHLARESRIVRRLQREARTTARLAHPHIVSAVDMGESAGRWWYAMEFVDGPSLAQRLKAEGRIREREALRLFIPLCEALEHLWEHGVVHRDIKPGNILIDKAGGARLADLGLAMAEDDPSITGTGGTLGTPHYISPEQAVDPRKADVRSDIWSFGATLFHAVCGRPPFSGESAAEVLSGVLYLPIPDPEELEPALSGRLALVLRKCLTRDPARRYQDPHELLLDLERVRERRAPKVERRSLDPVQRFRDTSRRTALLATGGLVALLAALVFLLPRLVGSKETPLALAPGADGPFEPLVELASRHAGGRGRPAELLGELQALEPGVPLRERPRYEELLRAVDGDLRRAVREVRTAVEGEFDAWIAADDLAAAWRLVGDELDARFARATGAGLTGLARVGTELGPWRDRFLLDLEGRTEQAVSELEALLLDWQRMRLSTVENALAQHDWERAFAALRLPSEEQVFAELGFGLRLPAVSKAGLLDDLAVEFRLRTLRLEDEWQALDRELRAFVATRRATLERQLREGRPRIAAEATLRADFERELFDRRLTREKMPSALSRAGLDALEDEAHALALLEETLLEEDARSDYAVTEELAEDALRRRDYGRALALWQEARERIAEAPRYEFSLARGELVRRLELRRAEAELLDTLLERVAERLRALDGQTIELRWGSILYPGARLAVGPDPRRDGFRADTIPGLLRLSDLPGPQLETFAGLGAEGELGSDQRLTLAAFRLHDGRASDAERVLLAAPPGESELARALGAHLAARIARTLEQGQALAGAREAEARRLLEDVTREEFRRHSPRVAQARVNRLLEEFGDLPLIKQKRGELLRLRAGLEESAPRDAERELALAFAPDSLELASHARVRLGYRFEEGRLGAWQAGDWVFDGLGMVLGPSQPILGWDQLVAEHGLRLILRTPLVPDAFELRLRFEALQGETPGRLLWINAAGFQIALGSAELPGGNGSARYLVGTEEATLFLQRLMAGEGRRAEPVLVPGTAPRELVIRGQRRSGRGEVTLDGVSLGTLTGLRAPPSDARVILMRSWGSVRILEVALEAGR
jgi:serine/threonine-protein kinase